MKLILGRDIGWGCRCAPSWCDLDLIFDLAVVTLTFKLFSGLYFGKVKEVNSWQGQCHDVALTS